MNLPETYVDVMVTYEKNFYSGPYRDTVTKQTVTRRGLYSNSDGYYDARNNWVETPNGLFMIPEEWKTFNGKLMPHGWHPDRVRPENVIKWEYCD